MFCTRMQSVLIIAFYPHKQPCQGAIIALILREEIKIQEGKFTCPKWSECKCRASLPSVSCGGFGTDQEEFWIT